MTNPDSSELRIDSPTPRLAAEEASRYWQWFMPAWELSRFDYTFEEFQAQIEEGTILILRVWRGTEPVALAGAKKQETNDGNELLVMALVGFDESDWLDELEQALTQVAIESECGHITVKGRPGWTKKLRRKGYKLHQVTLRRDVRGKLNGQFRQ